MCFYHISLQKFVCVQNANVMLATHEICMCACAHGCCGRVAMLGLECAIERCVCECLINARQQDSLRQHRLPVGG